MANPLIERGEKVRVLDLWKDPNSNPDIEYFIGDINDSTLVKRAMHNVDFVHHNVALVPLSKAGKDYWKVNLEGTETALQEAAAAKVKSFLICHQVLFLDCQKLKDGCAFFYAGDLLQYRTCHSKHISRYIISKTRRSR